MDDRKTFLDYWLVIYRNRAVVLLTLASAMATAWIVSESRDPIYQAQTVFFLPNPLASMPSSFFSGPELPAQVPVLPVTNRALERVYLGILESEAIRKIVAEEVPGKSAFDLIRDADVEISRNHVVEVQVRDEDPDLAARVANAYPLAMERFLLSLSSSQRERNLEAMGNVLSDAEDQLDAARQELLDFLLEQGTPDVGQESLALVRRRQQLEDQVQAVQAELDALDQRLLEAEERFRREAATWGGGGTADADKEVSDDPDDEELLLLGLDVGRLLLLGVGTRPGLGLLGLRGLGLALGSTPTRSGGPPAGTGLVLLGRRLGLLLVLRGLGWRGRWRRGRGLLGGRGPWGRFLRFGYGGGSLLRGRQSPTVPSPGQDAPFPGRARSHTHAGCKR